jgi:hypothetical protein
MSHPMKTKTNSGATIIAVIALLTVLSAFVIGALTYTGTVATNVMASNSYRKAVEVGDGALDYMFAYWRELAKEAPNTLRPTTDFVNIPLPAQSLFPGVTSFTASTGANPATGTRYTIANYKVQATNPELVPMSPTSAAPTVGTGMQVNTNTAYYLASADVTIPGFAGRQITVQVRRVFQKQQQSPWEYAIFYNDLLEMNPGAPQTISGWVHTNGNLYTAMNDLTFVSKVDYAGDWGTSWAPGDSDHSGQTPASPVWPTNLPPARGQIQLPFGMDPTQVFTSTDANNTGYIELIQPPVTSQADPIPNNRYYDQANIRILIDTNNNVTMTDNSNNTISSSTANMSNSPQPTYSTRALYMLFNGAVTTNQSFQDNREGATMRIATLDVSAITSALTTPANGGTGYLLGYNLGTWGSGSSKVVSDSTHTVGTVAWSGIVYMTDTSGSATVKRGVRIKNGATIATPGLTLASQNPVYVQGDFNTGRTGTSETPTNTANNGTGNNVVSGYKEQPCAVLGDAVNVLSNNWQDANSTKDLSLRVATPTTVNSAIVSGIVPTGGGSGANSYSGGEENFPRFLEDWSGGKTFTYYGSMVELFKSQQSTGYWGSSNVYNAPNRNWHFDTLFYTQPPPGTLLVVTYVKGRWFVQ